MAEKKHKKKNLIDKKIKTIFIFLIKLNLLVIPLYAIIYYNFSIPAFQNFIASLSYSILKIAGYDFSLQGSVLSTFIGNKFMEIEISWDSTGWKSLYILSALIIATPLGNWNRKLLFILAALPAIFLINLARVTTTIIASINFGFQYFDFLHLFLWRAVSIASVIIFWLIFLKREKNNIR